MTTGILSMTAEQYRAASGVSNSDREWIAPPRTPMHFRAKMDGLIVDEETPAKRIGTITHRCILEPETMEGAFHIKPQGMNFATKEGKEWKAARDRSFPIISLEEANSIKSMAQAVWRHPTASRILKGADFERSAFAMDGDLLLKARFDCLPKTGNVIADLKTIESADLESVEKAMFNYAYFKQAAHYLRVANLLALGRDAFVFIFVEKSPPFAVACYQLADEVIRAGEMLVERDLQLLRNCMASNKWPGYGDGIMPAALPPFAMKGIEQIS